MLDSLELNDGRIAQAFELLGPEPGEALDIGIALGQAGEARDGLIEGADAAGGEKARRLGALAAEVEQLAGAVVDQLIEPCLS